MKTIFSFVLILLAFLLSHAQAIDTHNYNLPPGFVFGKKGLIHYDLSYKIEGRPSTVLYNDSDLVIAKSFTESELEEIKNISIENYNYYKMANAFFNSLSDKIKNMYTKNELWYIYVFDQNLKNKLVTVK